MSDNKLICPACLAKECLSFTKSVGTISDVPVCYHCGDKILNGNEYLQLIKNIYDYHVKSSTWYFPYDIIHDKVKEYQDIYDKKYQRMLNGLKDENIDEVVDFLIKY